MPAPVPPGGVLNVLDGSDQLMRLHCERLPETERRARRRAFPLRSRRFDHSAGTARVGISFAARV
jgi:hypothetical protein